MSLAPICEICQKPITSPKGNMVKVSGWTRNHHKRGELIIINPTKLAGSAHGYCVEAQRQAIPEQARLF